MELTELKTLWQTYDNKLERSLALNLHILEHVGEKKVAASFHSLMATKILSIFLGIAWNLLLGTVLYYFHSDPLFVLSIGMIMLFTTVAIAGYIYQVILIRRIRFSDPILETQRKLAVLQTSIIWLARILFLQIPFYATLFVPVQVLRNGNIWQWLIIGLAIVFFMAIAIWLYRNISFKNLRRNWVKTLVQNEGGKSITKAIQYINEIEAFRKDIIS